jgi:hypothetical protein
MAERAAMFLNRGRGCGFSELSGTGVIRDQNFAPANSEIPHTRPVIAHEIHDFRSRNC